MPGIPTELRQFRCLLGHFFAGFFDNDWISKKGDLGATFTPIFGLIAVPGLLIPLLLYPLYVMLPALPPVIRNPTLWAHMSFYIAFAMLVMGLASVVEWDALFPDIRDYRILTPLPVRLRTLFASKLAALLLFVLCFTLMAGAGSTAMFPLATGGLGGNVFRFAGAHAAALAGGALFTFFLVVTSQGLAMNLLTHRWFRRVSPLLQLVTLITVLLGFFLFPKMAALLDPREMQLHPALLWYPPVWFVGLYVSLAGMAGPAMAKLAGAATLALAAGAASCAAVYTLSYWRHVRRTLEAPPGTARGPGRSRRAAAWLAGRLVLRDPLERASFYFMASTIVRSRRHRLVLATCTGLGIAVALDSLSLVLLKLNHAAPDRPGTALLSIQLVLSFFVLCGLRYSFAIPAELRANWVFRAAESADGWRHVQAARKALILFGGVPPLVALFPLHLALWGWKVALCHAAFGMTLAAVLAAVLLAGFSRIPFACSYLPGKANVKLLAAGYVLAFVGYAYALASLEASLLREPPRLLLFCGSLWAGLAACNYAMAWKRRAAGGEFELVYEDAAEPAVRTLDLAS